MAKTLIFGHQKPDTDSVTSAIVLSYLKNELGEKTEPRVLGNISRETSFVLNYFDVKAPKYLNDVRIQVKDVHYEKGFFLHEKDSIFKAYNQMRETNISMLPIVSSEGKYKGAVSLKHVMSDLISGNFNRVRTSYDNLLEALEGKAILRFDKEIEGEIISPSYRSITFKEEVKIDRDSVLITGDRHSIIEYAVNSSASIIILTNNVEMLPEHLEIAKKNKVDIIQTHYNGITAANLVILSNYIEDIASMHIICVNENDSLFDVLDMANKKKFSNYPVLSNSGKCRGIFRVSTADNNKPKKVILVDHNEKEQSVIGLDEAEIVEIVDHHKIGNIGTTMPINFRNMPVGCTNTILYLMFKEQNVDIPRHIAGLMMAGIISDTLLLTSPTTTLFDKSALLSLSKQTGIDYTDFGMQMFNAGSSIEGKSVGEIIHGDFKNFMIDNQKVGIGQISTMNTKEILKRKNEIILELNNMYTDEDYRATALFITDILKNGSYILFNEKSQEIFENAFNLENIKEAHFFEGLVSRKKQIVPKLMSYLDK